MEKLNRTIKIKILFVIAFTNLSMYMIASTPTEDYEIPTTKFVETREGYIDFKVKGELLTSFAINKPITILNGNKKTLIPYGVLKERIGTESSAGLGSEETNDEYIIYLPQSYISQLIGHPNLHILPYGKTYSKKSKKVFSYEITI